MNNQQQNTNPATILEFARLQLAAEVLYGFKNATPNWEVAGRSPSIGNLSFENLIEKDKLESGNDHNSKFTPTDAAEFADNWEMVAQLHWFYNNSTSMLYLFSCRKVCRRIFMENLLY